MYKDASTLMKEDNVANYISSLDLTGDFSVKQIKEHLKILLGEEPALKINWVSDTPLFEGGKKIDSKIERVKSVVITFSDGEDENGKPKIHTIEILK